jgi:hypothetical protein
LRDLKDDKVNGFTEWLLEQFAEKECMTMMLGFGGSILEMVGKDFAKYVKFSVGDGRCIQY